MVFLTPGSSYRTRPLTQIVGMSWRDGDTFASLLNELNKKFETEVPAEFEKFYEWARDLFDFLNDRIGSPTVQFVDLTANAVIEMPGDLPTSHDVYFQFRQNAVGGHIVTLGEKVHGSITVSSAPGSYSLVHVVPRGDGDWDAYTLDDQISELVISSSKTRVELVKLINSTTAAKIDAISKRVDDLQDEFADFQTSITAQFNAFKTTVTQLVATETTNSDFGKYKDLSNEKIVATQIIPTARVEYKRSSLGYQYEVLSVDTQGYRVPSLMSRRFSKDMQDSVGKGDGFIFPDGQREDFSLHVAKARGAGVVFNCSGMQTLQGINPPYAMLRGVQIHNGKVYRDFEPASNRGRHALGWRKDGTFKSYSIEWGDSASSMIADGVVESYGFGPTLVRNGVSQNIEALTYYGSLVSPTELSGRTILGSTQDGEVRLITVTGVSSEKWGVAGNNIVSLAVAEGLHNAIMLDGGGSTQAAANGSIYHPSSDSAGDRVMGDVGIIRCAAVSPNSALSIGKEPIKITNSNLVQDNDVYAPGATYKGGLVTVSGALAFKEGFTFPAGEWLDVGTVPKFARPDIPLGSGIFFSCPTNSRTTMIKVQIRAFGQISVTTNDGAINGFELNFSYAGK